MSTRAKSRGKKKQKTSKVGERAPSPVPPPPQCPRSPSPPPEDLPGADEVPGPSQPRDDKAEKKKEKRPRKSFTLKPDQEDNAFEWLAENELSRRLSWPSTACSYRYALPWSGPLHCMASLGMFREKASSPTMKYGTSWVSLGKGSGFGQTIMSPFSRPCFSSLWSYI
ncbi:uncharacterized protein LOC121428356 [Lytechinus variegatus]|uniref:uncharacterized protein LOC121428356 n=1 Tax=Lytechinus variegatus TaxID=7654 RepID=UPI001BB18E00|nr:uncharacterized protein LOC121428356 [Lytechinus variegatus]